MIGKTFLAAAVTAAALLSPAAPADAAVAPVPHSKVVQLRQGLHDWRKHPTYPACRTESGSGQYGCFWNARAHGYAISFYVRVTKVFRDGDVNRRYTYVTAPYKGHTEDIRQPF